MPSLAGGGRKNAWDAQKMHTSYFASFFPKNKNTSKRQKDRTKNRAISSSHLFCLVMAVLKYSNTFLRRSLALSFSSISLNTLYRTAGEGRVMRQQQKIRGKRNLQKDDIIVYVPSGTIFVTTVVDGRATREEGYVLVVCIQQ